MKKFNCKSLLKLKRRQQTNQSAESLLANQKVRTKRHLKYSVVKLARKTFGQRFSFHHHLHVGHTYVNVTLIVPDGSLGFQQQDQKQVDVFGYGNNIAETINSNINTKDLNDDGE